MMFRTSCSEFGELQRVAEPCKVLDADHIARYLGSDCRCVVSEYQCTSEVMESRQKVDDECAEGKKELKRSLDLVERARM